MMRTQRKRPSQCISPTSHLVVPTFICSLYFHHVLTPTLSPSIFVRLHCYSRPHIVIIFFEGIRVVACYLCRNAEFLCLLILLPMLKHFTPALFVTPSHTHTWTASPSHLSLSLPSRRISVSPPAQHVSACASMRERQGSRVIRRSICFSMFMPLHNSQQSSNLSHPLPRGLFHSSDSLPSIDADRG
jgi:hypothetical protein